MAIFAVSIPSPTNLAEFPGNIKLRETCRIILSTNMLVAMMNQFVRNICRVTNQMYTKRNSGCHGTELAPILAFKRTVMALISPDKTNAGWNNSMR